MEYKSIYSIYLFSDRVRVDVRVSLKVMQQVSHLTKRIPALGAGRGA